MMEITIQNQYQVTKEFVETYKIGLIRNADDWRIHQFKYNIKFTTENFRL